MPIIRSKHSFDGQFTQIPNAWLRDTRLSLKAIGLLAQLMSHSVGWKISIRTLAQANGCGPDMIRSAIDELLEHGYLVRSKERERNAQGHLGDYVYATNEPTSGFPTLDFPTLDNPTTKNTSSKEQHAEEKTYAQQAERESVEIDFETFWKQYPRKVGKDAARRLFFRLHSAHRDDMLAGVARYATDPNLPPMQFVPHATTWLNRAGWDDEPLPERILTAEEKKAKEEREAAERRERERVKREEQRERDRLEREREAAERAANPVERCEHDRILVLCKKCWDAPNDRPRNNVRPNP